MSDDLAQLAQRLRVGPGELERAIGGPWVVALRIPERESEQPGTLLVGRAGPCVGPLVTDEPDPALLIGHAVGQWVGPATLQWSVADVVASLVTPTRGAPDAEVDAFLEQLRESVDSAFRLAQSSLVLCRYCGSVVAPEHAYSDDACQACGSRVFGVVY